MKSKLFLVLALSICMLSLSACAVGGGRTARRTEPTPSPYQGQNIIQTSPAPGGMLGATPAPDGILGGTPAPGGILGGTPAPNAGTQYPRGALAPQGMAADRARAENIKKQLATLKEVRDVNVIVIGDTALIGYTPSPASRDANATRNLVASKCKQVDNRVASVTCTDAPDIAPNIGQLAADVANNRPANDITARFNELVRRIRPDAR